MGRKILGEEVVKLEDGVHTGVVSRIEFKDEPYKYTDIYIADDKTKVEVRCGVPTKVCDISALGNILVNFGLSIRKGAEYDIEEILKGKKVQFITITEKTERGSFPKVQPLSIKPIK